MQEKEAELGQPFEEFVVELYAQHRNYEGVATAMGISRQTLQVWRRLVGLSSGDLRRAMEERKELFMAQARASVPPS